MSVPAPSTVNVLDAADAPPRRTGAPTSADVHGAGKVCAKAALLAAHRNTAAVSSARKSLLIQPLHRSGVTQRGCRSRRGAARADEIAKVGANHHSSNPLPFRRVSSTADRV